MAWLALIDSIPVLTRGSPANPQANLASGGACVTVIRLARSHQRHLAQGREPLLTNLRAIIECCFGEQVAARHLALAIDLYPSCLPAAITTDPKGVVLVPNHPKLVACGCPSARSAR